MNKLFALVVLLGCAAVRSVIITNDTDVCWDSPASQSVTEVGISPCDRDVDTDSCILWKGRNSTISLTFTLAEDTNILTSVVKGNVFMSEWAMPDFTDEMAVVCKPDDAEGTVRHGVSCPVKAGVVQHFSFSLPVSTTFPSWNVPVLWRFVDVSPEVYNSEGGNTLLCQQMATSLQTPKD